MFVYGRNFIQPSFNDFASLLDSALERGGPVEGGQERPQKMVYCSLDFKHNGLFGDYLYFLFFKKGAGCEPDPALEAKK